jgi:hypothetical protein
VKAFRSCVVAWSTAVVAVGSMAGNVKKAWIWPS